MRLSLKLLNSDASINNFKYLNMLSVARGETTNLVFQLCDKDQAMNRWIPGAQATVTVAIQRAPVVGEDPNLQNTRLVTDYSISRQASPLNSGDRSLWMLPLSAQDTQNLISDSIKVTVVDGANTYIASLNAAIKIQDNQD